MKKLGDLIAVISFSIAALLNFHIFPEIFPNSDLNSIFQYGVMSATFIYFIWAYQLPTMRYFRMPAISMPSLFGLLIAFFYSFRGIQSSDGYHLALLPTISGVFYLYSIGLGEEVVSRGFVFGVLRKHGVAFALFFSSATFGLMHLNVYLGEDWSPVNAYWHCLSAAGFGFLAAAVMLATRSILPAIIMHALYDWPVIFSPPVKEVKQSALPHFDPLWQTIKDSFAEIAIDSLLALFLLLTIRLSRIRKFPRFLIRPFKYFGLIEEEEKSG